MHSKIEIEKENKYKTIDAARYQASQIWLKYDGKLFRPDILTPEAEKIQKHIRKRYWDAIGKFYLDGCTMVVRLSGLHFSPDDAKKYLFAKDSRRNNITYHYPRRDNMILHYLRWVVEEDGTLLDDRFALFECGGRGEFKRLFNEFWVALGFELRFEGILLRPQRVLDIEKWSRREENARTYNALIRMSELVFDNQHNGFHFRVISNEKYSELVNNILLSLLS